MGIIYHIFIRRLTTTIIFINLLLLGKSTIKSIKILLGIKANGHYLRQVAVTCRGGISVVRNLKFLTPFFIFLTINIILSTNRSYVISPCNTNKYFRKYKELVFYNYTVWKSIYTHFFLFFLPSSFALCF